MFTGIVSDMGTVRAITGADPVRLRIRTNFAVAEIDDGASVACAGICLTVVERGDDWLGFDVSAETLSRTTLGDWEPGTPVNFERALKLGDELGGHLVSGHVDGVTVVAACRAEGDSQRLTFVPPGPLARFIAPKGSVTLDGISLTVNEVEDDDTGECRFGVNIIPHTARATTLGGARQGMRVNLEIDLLARYVQRLLQRE